MSKKKPKPWATYEKDPILGPESQWCENLAGGGVYCWDKKPSKKEAKAAWKLSKEAQQGAALAQPPSYLPQTQPLGNIASGDPLAGAVSPFTDPYGMGAASFVPGLTMAPPMVPSSSGPDTDSPKKIPTWALVGVGLLVVFFMWRRHR